MSKSEEVLSIAKKQIGTKEFPANSNRTKYGKWYGLDGNPWCMMFVMWCFHQAEALAALPMKTASCGALMRAAQKAGCWITSGYKPGDVLIFDFPGGAATDHTGILVRCSGSTVTAIEGNTSVGNDSDGGMVMQRIRKLSLVKGAVRPDWAKVEPAIEETAAKIPAAVKVGDTVKFTGERQYLSSLETAGSVKARPCNAVITLIRLSSAHPYHVKGPTVEGWVNAADVEDIGYRATVKVSDFLAVRSGPGTQYAMKDRLHNGDTVTIVETSGEWGRLQDGGWVYLRYVEKQN